MFSNHPSVLLGNPEVTSGADQAAEFSSATPLFLPGSDAPEAVIARLSAERLRDFHYKRRILVIDDIPETAARLTASLTKLYGEVEFETDPVQALARIAAMGEQGRPYDAIVLDLYMPGMLGTELLKQLGSGAPAIVINTGSMMAPVVGAVASAIDSYVTEQAGSLFDQIRDEQARLGLPTIAIYTHHKLDALAKLVDKLDTAMLIRQFVTDSTARFLSTFNPNLSEIVFTEETLHLIAEEVRNFTLALAPLLAPDRGHPALRQSEWWSKNGEAITKAFSALSRTSFSSLVGETPALSISNTHTLVNMLAMLRPPAPELLSSREGTESRKSLETWAAQWEQLTAAINSRHLALQQYHNGDLDVGRLVADLYPEAFLDAETTEDLSPYSEDQAPPSPLIKDPDRIVRSFLPKLIEAFNARIGFSDQPNARVDAELYPEHFQGEHWVPEALVRLFAKYNCGDYWKVILSDSTGRPLDQDFAALAPAISTLQRAGLGFIETHEYQEDAGVSYFVVYLKAGEKNSDYVSEIDRIAQEKIKQADGTWIYSVRGAGVVCKVREDLGKHRDIVAIGALPDPKDRYHKPVLYRHEHLKFWCTASDHSHYSSAVLINDILAEREAKSGNQDGAVARRHNTETCRDIYHDCVRVLGNGDRFILEVWPRELKQHWAFQTLIELGIPASKIEGNPLSFLSRA